MSAIVEKLVLRRAEFSALVENTALRGTSERDSLHTGVRIYKGGCIGVAGFTGERGFDSALKSAKEALKNNISSPPPDEAHRESRKSGAWPLSPAELVEETNAVCTLLSRDYPDFVFSGGMKLLRDAKELSNDAGLELSSTTETLRIAIRWRKKSPENFMDGTFALESAAYNRDSLMSSLAARLDCGITQPPQNTSLVLELDRAEPLLGFFAMHMDGRIPSASALALKFNKRVFSRDFSLVRAQNPQTDFNHFFDDEGCRADGAFLIENGTPKNRLADRRSAALNKLVRTACAQSAFDAVPDVATGESARKMLKIAGSGRTLDELLHGAAAVYAPRGYQVNFTEEGGLAIIIPQAFVLQDGKFAGLLPGFKVVSDVYSVFGAKFGGVAEHEGQRCLVLSDLFG
jgi:PmbA protein